MKKCISVLSAALAAALTLSIPVIAEDHSKAEEYLQEYYNVEPVEEDSLESVNAALTALGGEALEGEELNEEELIAAGIRLAGLEELALTYINDDVPDKAAKKIASIGMEVSEEYAPYVACALDLGLLVDEDGANSASDYLYRCAEIAGKGRRFLGRVSDDDILTKLRSEMESFVLFDEEGLTNLGTEIVLSGATTGYNLKYAGYDAHFLADYTLKYGHDDFQHAQQLIGLLRSEDIDAYIQIEPKVSVYEYMTDWGDPGEPTPTYAVREVTEDRYLCYAVEYDMMLEFDTKEEKEAFHGLIETYAKKYDDSVDEEGNVTEKLLAGSWWQPLYSSATEMQNEEFGELIDNVIYDADGLYSVHSFSLPENAAAIEEKVAELTPDLSVSPVTIYVNPAFMRYITGEDHQ